MYKKWNKSASKRFLLFALIIFFGGLIISGIILMGIKSRGAMRFDLTSIQLLLVSFACALVPLFSFTGFSVLFVSVDELTPKKLLALILFCVPLAILVIPIGCAMLIPTTIVSIKKALR